MLFHYTVLYITVCFKFSIIEHFLCIWIRNMVLKSGWTAVSSKLSSSTGAASSQIVLSKAMPFPTPSLHLVTSWWQGGHKVLSPFLHSVNCKWLCQLRSSPWNWLRPFLWYHSSNPSFFNPIHSLHPRYCTIVRGLSGVLVKV